MQYSAVAANYPPNSFPRVFWEQQLKMATTNDSRGHRWHPLKIKWALYLQHKSRSRYRALRSFRLLLSPSPMDPERYIRTVSIKASVGFSDKVDMQLMCAPEVANAENTVKNELLI